MAIWVKRWAAYTWRKHSRPEARQATLKMTGQIEQAMGDEIRNLPWMGAETKKHALEKLHAIVNKIGYPDKWRDYSSVVVSRDDFLGDVEPRHGFRIPPRAQQNRQARGPHRVEHDAAHGERLLRPADERHQFPGGRAAAASVRSEAGHGAQLRRYRRNHRARTDPRLRRRRPPVRCARAI